MPAILSHFRIEGLHNRYTIDIPIQDNKLVLIGENGSGKSTVANFIYFFLSNQWHRMIPYDFKTIRAIINDQIIEFSKEDLTNSKSVVNTIHSDFDVVSLHQLVLEQEQRLAKRNALMHQLAKRNASDRISIGYSELLEEYSRAAFNRSEKIEKASQLLHMSMKDHIRVLYLPTYRRIEQDLTAIFPELTASSSSNIASELTSAMKHLRNRTQSSKYLELVQFGMQDVEDIITAKIDELSKSWRDDLNKLTGIYLRDIIRGEYKSSQLVRIEELDDTTLNAIFNRIDQSVLPELEQGMLRHTLDKIRIQHRIEDEDMVAAHFLTRLIEMHKKQQEKEKGVREFIHVCNQYLSGKEFVYDDLSFEISIRLLYRNGHIAEKKNDDAEILEMNMLSSGEKQIISLFSQIYLNDNSHYFVIIDEPELSLSVMWQKRFLPDILKSGRCSGLIATTHSPFICDNELDSYMYPINQFVEELNGFHQ